MQVFEWHPSDPAVLVAGLANGQLVSSLSSPSPSFKITRYSGTSAHTWRESRRALVPGITGEGKVSNRVVNKTVENIEDWVKIVDKMGNLGKHRKLNSDQESKEWNEENG